MLPDPSDFPFWLAPLTLRLSRNSLCMIGITRAYVHVDYLNHRYAHIHTKRNIWAGGAAQNLII